MGITIKEIILTLSSGLGVFVLGFFIKKRYEHSQKQKVSKNSEGYQAGRDMYINKKKEMDEENDANTKS